MSIQGPSGLGIAANAKMATWTCTDRLASIEVPKLVIGARYDSMDPAHMEMMAHLFPDGRYLYCPDGSHLAMYDDQQRYFAGLIAFLHDLADWPSREPGPSTVASIEGNALVNRAEKTRGGAGVRRNTREPSQRRCGDGPKPSSYGDAARLNSPHLSMSWVGQHPDLRILERL